MKFTMPVPCDTCPFRNTGVLKLHKSRIREISAMMLDWQGGTFPCHKSVDYDREDERESDPSDHTPGPGEVHCAGALAYALNQGHLPQLARIMERLGEFDGDKILAAAGHLVWPSLKAWLAGGSIEGERKTCKKGTTPS